MFVEQEIVIHSWVTGKNGAIKNRISSTAWINNDVSDKKNMTERKHVLKWDARCMIFLWTISL